MPAPSRDSCPLLLLPRPPPLPPLLLVLLPRPVVALCRPLVDVVARRDRDLGSQLRRAASSVALNLAEGFGSTAGNSRLRFESARGSLYETQAGIRVAIAWATCATKTPPKCWQPLIGSARACMGSAAAEAARAHAREYTAASLAETPPPCPRRATALSRHAAQHPVRRFSDTALHSQTERACDLLVRTARRSRDAAARSTSTSVIFAAPPRHIAKS